MIKVYSFKMEDLNFFKLEDNIPFFEEQMIRNVQDPNRDIVSLSTESGKVIAFAGLNHLRSGVAEAWIIRGEGINDNKLGFYRAIKRMVEFAIQKMKLHRFEVAISHDFKGGGKWAESLGCHYEHTCKAYDMNYIDHDIYVRITKWQQEQQ